MGQFVDITGHRYNRLTVVRLWPDKNLHGRTQWLCRCDCGKDFVTTSNGLRTGNTKSCGCINRERCKTGDLSRHHGYSGQPIYSRWRCMIRRCYEPQFRDYDIYGGRGITVCQRWRDSVKNFVADMGLPPECKTLDRIDTNGPYSADNCRWADDTTQARNKRTNRLLTFNGRTMCISAWAKELGLCKNMIRSRLNLGWTIEEALTKPIREKKQSCHK